MITLSRLPTVRPNEARGGTKYWKKIRTLLKLLKTNWRPVKTSQSHVIKCVGVTKKRKIFIKLSRFNAPTHALKKIWHCLQRKLTVWKTSDKCVKNEMSTAWKAIEKAHLIGEDRVLLVSGGALFFNERFNQSVYRVSISVRGLFFPWCSIGFGPFDDGIWMKFMRAYKKWHGSPIGRVKTAWSNV